MLSSVLNFILARVMVLLGWKRCTHRDVKVTLTFKQVEPGNRYTGSLVIGTGNLAFDICFTVPLSDLNKGSITAEKIHDFVELTLQRGEEAIELSDEEFWFFSSLIAELMLKQDFVLNPFRIANVGPICGVQIVTCNFCSCICKILASPKFGCELLEINSQRPEQV